MKKYLVLIVSIMFNIQAFAQKGDVVVGVNTSYGTEIKNVHYGISILISTTCFPWAIKSRFIL